MPHTMDNQRPGWRALATELLSGGILVVAPGTSHSKPSHRGADSVNKNETAGFRELTYRGRQLTGRVCSTSLCRPEGSSATSCLWQRTRPDFIFYSLFSGSEPVAARSSSHRPSS